MNQNRLSSESERALRATHAQARVAVMTERLSGRQIDFCVLALCSCALTLMCHQAISLGYTSSSNSSAVRTSSTGALTQLDFNIKSGLVVTRKEAASDND